VSVILGLERSVSVGKKIKNKREGETHGGLKNSTQTGTMRRGVVGGEPKKKRKKKENKRSLEGCTCRLFQPAKKQIFREKFFGKANMPFTLGGARKRLEYHSSIIWREREKRESTQKQEGKGNTITK